jgi:hypothetical protein
MYKENFLFALIKNILKKSFMKKKSLKVNLIELAKNELRNTKGGTRSAYDLDEVTQTGKKKQTITQMK